MFFKPLNSFVMKKEISEKVFNKAFVLLVKIVLTALLVIITNKWIGRLEMDPNGWTLSIQTIFIGFSVYAGFKIWSDKFLSEDGDKTKQTESSKTKEIVG